MTTKGEGLQAGIQYVKGVGPKLGQILTRRGIATIEDAIHFLPRTYEDRRRITPIGELRPGVASTVFGKVVTARGTRGRGRVARFEATLSDGTGSLFLNWFHAYPSLMDEFEEGASFLVYGVIDFFAGKPRLSHPDYERAALDEAGKPLPSPQFGRVVPVYTEPEGLHQKVVRRIVGTALKQALPSLDDPLPEAMLSRYGLPRLRESFLRVHYPPEAPPEGKLPPEARRLIFEEFFVLQLGLQLKKRGRERATGPVLADRGAAARFTAGLPFPLTGDQKKAVAAILADIARPQPMTRLVQGDVGAGKTVVALAAAAVAHEAGFQTAMMAPTEILAQQHFRAAERWLAPLGIRPVLLAASSSGRCAAREAVASGEASFVVGTHAIFQDAVKFRRLGLVVVDEQHRFGVDQRGELLKKGDGLVPHLLLMTATPIPRTLAFTLYGDLELTVIREKPAGRQPVETRVVTDRDRPRLYRQMRDTVARGEQVYVIYPLVEASEKLDLKSATDMHARLSKEVFPDLKIALLHGRMKSEEKDRVLVDFKDKKYDILISTTVIEVGIDVPNATLMVIEHPERLGLSQLHQLRGRVGRGSAASECLLVAGQFVTERLRIMETSDDGFVIAEEDLRIRGPGEFLGTRQHGLPGFRVGHIVRDAELLSEARTEAMRLLETDPELASPENLAIRGMVESRWKEKLERLRGA